MTKLTGIAAISHAERHGMKLCKHADATEGARDNLSTDEARDIAREDASLIYLEVSEATAAAVSLGSARSAAKTAAARANGATGGRPVACNYRAYDTTTEWSGRPRRTVEEAQADADAHNRWCARQSGYGSAIVAQRDGDRLMDMTGQTIWPPHGMTSGAARWR